MNKSECPQWIKQKAVNQTGKCKIDGLYCHKENERTNKVEFDRCEVYWKAKAEKQAKVIADIETLLRNRGKYAVKNGFDTYCQIEERIKRSKEKK